MTSEEMKEAVEKAKKISVSMKEHRIKYPNTPLTSEDIFFEYFSEALLASRAEVEELKNNLECRTELHEISMGKMVELNRLFAENEAKLARAVDGLRKILLGGCGRGVAKRTLKEIGEGK